MLYTCIHYPVSCIVGGATSTPKSSSADHLKKQKDAKTLSTNKPVLENQLQLAVNVRNYVNVNKGEMLGIGVNDDKIMG